MNRRVLLSLIILIAASLAGALSAEASKVTVEIGDFGIDYSITSKQGSIRPGMFSNMLSAYEPALPWEFKRVTAGVYHVRIPTEKNVFLKLDAGAKKVFIVSGGTFGKSGGSEKIIQDAKFLDPPPPLGPDPNSLHVVLPRPVLVYDTETKDVGIFSQGLRLLGPEEIEIVKAEEGIYHVRARGTRFTKTSPPTFKVINLATKTLSTASGVFGERVAGALPQDYKVTVETGKAAAPEPAVHKDLGMAELRKEMVRESAWIAAEQEMFSTPLSKQRFDVLVVPVQVQDNAFDHIERSLMTKYLVQRIRSTTNLRVPDPDAVERSLGWGLRTFSQQRIYDLANATGVNKLIRIYAGHNRDMKMRLTAVIQERSQGASFDTGTPARDMVFKDVVFSDEKLPSDAFADLLPSIMYGIGIKETRKDAPRDRGVLGNVPVPPSPAEMVRGKEKSPLVLASYLAMLGSLSPVELPAGERFLTRSLMMLRGAAPASPDAVFLKAYAFSMLHRRPAALALLQKPSTPEQAALRSYLDGDLSTLPALVEKVQSPIPKLLVQNALNDLRWSYDQQTARQRSVEALQSVPAGWRIFSTRRYSQSDYWDVPGVIELKKYLDEAYPVDEYSLSDVARSLAVRGGFDASDTVKLDITVTEHCRRLLKARPELLTGDPLGQVLPLDIIDLAEAWAEKSVYKRINLPVTVQALPAEGVAVAERYDVYFKGHPQLSALKSWALQKLADQKKGTERKNLGAELSEMKNATCIWLQGQSWAANYVCHSIYFYDNDFPRREFWHRYFESYRYGDREAYELRETTVTKPTATSPSLQPSLFEEAFKTELRDHDLALRYTISDFSRLESYYDALVAHGMMQSAETLTEKNKRRFIGNPARTAFLVRQYQQNGKEQEIPKLYEGSIGTAPGVWWSYYGLGYHFLSQGDTGRAREVFARYPLFREKKEDADPEAAEDTVMLSNNAAQAGRALHWTGATAEARSFFELSAGYRTGSGSGMRSEYYLSLYDGNYQTAAQEALALGRRYSNPDAYLDYVRLVCITGHSQETERLFFSLNLLEGRSLPWRPIITGLRMVGKRDAEVRGWLAQNGKGKVGRLQAQLFYLRTSMVDRPPDPALADTVQNIDKQVTLSEQSGPSPTFKDAQGRIILSTPALFAGSWYSVWVKKYNKVNELLEPWWSRAKDKQVKYDERALLPYLAWSGAKTGRKQAIDEALTAYARKNSKDFEYWLATAMVQAAAGKHSDALRSLDLARTNVNSSLEDYRPMQAWYQLVDACELLFEDTRVDAYRNRALELARIYQRVQPLDSWAYAVEAKLAKTATDRLRPLALTMYLDKQSFHIEGISKKEKEQALKWLENNNPFLKENGKMETRI